MKTRKCIKYFEILLILLIISSCSEDILNKEPLDKYTEEDIWGDYNLAQGFLVSTYDIVNQLHQNYKTDPSVKEHYFGWSDNYITNNDRWFAKENFDSFYDFGWNIYGDVRRCNMIIEKVTGSNFTEPQKKVMIAEAKMLRAILYFTRARLFGRLMIVDKVLDANENLKLSRTASIKDTYDFILKDLEDAANDLPTNVEQGRLSKGAALALRAEVALHGASFIETGTSEYYQEAISDSEVLFSLGYELDVDYENLFNNFKYATGSNEIILGVWRHEDNTTNNDGSTMQRKFPNMSNDRLLEGAPLLNDNFAGWVDKFPTQELVDDYLVIDADGMAKRWNKTTYYQEFLSNGGSVYNAMYKSRDKRFYASIVHDSSQYFNSMIYIRDGLGGNLHWASNFNEYAGWAWTKTGYYYRKGVYENDVLPAWDYPTPYHYTPLRLGRSYLNYAEALLRVGNINDAIEYINKTRQVHGGLPEIPKGTPEDEVLELYKIERRVELFDENDRYWSLLRWAKAEGKVTVVELTENPIAINIAEDGKSFELIGLPANVAQNSGFVFSERRFLLPVPEGERQNNENLDQNPGW